MNKKQLIVMWSAIILYCPVLRYLPLELYIPATTVILIIGGLLIYAFRDK